MEEPSSRPYPGVFITLEGGEGGGKSTLITGLAEHLSVQGYEVVTTREPGGTAIGNQIRGVLLAQESTPTWRAELLLFLAARAQNLDEVIRPALDAGKIVLCDRFNDSSVAYQGRARGGGEAYVRQLCDAVCEGIVPDLTLLIDVDTSVGLKRAGSHDRIEKSGQAFHQDVREAFLDMAKTEPKRFAVLEGNSTPEQTLAGALEVLNGLLRSQGA